MGKYLAYTILAVAILFFLEWLQIVDVPFLEIPDYISGKKEMIESSEGALNQLD